MVLSYCIPRNKTGLSQQTFTGFAAVHTRYIIALVFVQAFRRKDSHVTDK